MIIENAKYDSKGSITAFVDGIEMIIPADLSNRHYAEIVQKNISVAPYVEPAPTAEEIRTERDRLLIFSDWTQVADAPVDQGAWAVYRQELRDIPQQAGFPENVIWPTTPSV